MQADNGTIGCLRTTAIAESQPRVHVPANHTPNSTFPLLKHPLKRPLFRVSGPT